MGSLQPVTLSNRVFSHFNMILETTLKNVCFGEWGRCTCDFFLCVTMMLSLLMNIK